MGYVIWAMAAQRLMENQEAYRDAILLTGSRCCNYCRYSLLLWLLPRVDKGNLDPEQVRSHVEWFHQGYKPEWQAGVDAKKRGSSTISSLIMVFLEDTRVQWEDIHDRASACRVYFIPLLLSCVHAAIPGIVRLGKGESFAGESYADYAIYGLYAFYSVVFGTLILVSLHDWFESMNFAIWRFEAIVDMSNAYRSEMRGLRFYIPLNTPDNLIAFLRIRACLFKSLIRDLNSIAPIEMMLSPMVIIALALSIIVFINIADNNEIGVLIVLGIFEIVVLAGYLSGVLGIAAKANTVLNEDVRTMLSREKFQSSKAVWKISAHNSHPGSSQRRMQDAVSMKLMHRQELRRSMESMGRSIESMDKAIGSIDDRTKCVDRMCALEIMFDATLSRIADADQKLCIKAFGFRITFTALAALQAVLIASFASAGATIVQYYA